MPKRTRIHVQKNRVRDKWEVKIEGNKNPLSSHLTQRVAIEKGKQIAESEQGQLLIHREGNNRIRQERTYGKDKYPPRG